MSASNAYRRGVAIGAIALAGTLAAAVWFVCVQTWALPPTDLAYGHGPFEGAVVVIPVMSLGAQISYAVVGPAALALLWGADLRRSVPIVVATAFMAIGVLTPRLGIAAWPGSVVVTILAMALCRRLFPLHARQGIGDTAVQASGRV